MTACQWCGDTCTCTEPRPAAQIRRACTVYTSASDEHCGQTAGPTGRCETHDRRGKWSR